jgi:hypothetical protein
MALTAVQTEDAAKHPTSALGQSLQIVARRKPLYVCNAPDSDQIPHAVK